MTASDEAARHDAAQEAELHRRLLAQDPTAPDEAAHYWLPRLYAALRRRNPKVSDPHLLEEAAEIALLEYFKNPDRYDAARLSLSSYLLMAADRDLKNLLQREGRHRAHLVPLDPVAHGTPARNDEQDEDDEIALPPGVTREQVLQALWDKVQDPRDREVLRLMVIEQERRTEVFARVLGIEHLPRDAQRREVKRVKDRLNKMMRRLGEELRGH
jgi:hypothetical protein